MTNNELQMRQQRLLLRSGELRLSLSDQAQVFKRPLAVVDQARNSVLWIYRNPKWPLGALLLLTILRPRRAIVWGGRLWWTWKMVKKAEHYIANLPLRRIST